MEQVSPMMGRCQVVFFKMTVSISLITAIISIYSSRYTVLSVSVKPSASPAPANKGGVELETESHVWRNWFPALSSSACPAGQFKSGTEGQCRTCPAYSQSSTMGASVCTCRSEFLRAASDTPETPCTSKLKQPFLHLALLLLRDLWCPPPSLVVSSRGSLGFFVSFVPLLSFEMRVLCDGFLGAGLRLKPGH